MTLTNNPQKAHHHTLKLMGCRFTISAVHSCPNTAWKAIHKAVAEIKRIESLISSWTTNSQTTMINTMAGICPVSVDKELYNLINRSIRISKLTAGAFDISGTVSRRFWDFKSRKEVTLDPIKVKELRSKVDYRKIILGESDSSVFLTDRDMMIGFGGIGKGYAAHMAKKVMEENGIISGLINASGDLICWGPPLSSNMWKIYIPNPENSANPILDIKINHGSVVTSGNYENYILVNGKKHSHIIDPRTGLPVSHIKSVTVVSPNPEFADAMATALSVMEVNEGLNLINQLNGIECVIIDEFDQKHYSKEMTPHEKQVC